MVWLLRDGEFIRPFLLLNFTLLFDLETVADWCGFSVLCSDMAIKQIDEPFVSAKDDVDEWIL
jgi:hypothetical protein